MSPTERVLILDGQTNQALACVRSLGEAGYDVLVASDARFPLAGWSRHCRASYRLREQSRESFAEMREWAHRRGVSVVLPVTERSCVLCNAGRAEWAAAGIVLGCATDEMLEAAFDKSLTIRHAVACGVRVPETRTPGSLDECLSAAEEVGFPCVVKPRRSNSRDGAHLARAKAPIYVNSRDELPRAVAACRQGGEWPLIQAYVKGRGKGVFALCDNGRVVARFAHERLRDTSPTGSGSSLRRSVVPESRLLDPAEKLLAEMKWHGPAMVEFKDDGQNAPCLMEVNGRFWGSLQLGVDAGVNFPLLWVSILKGEEVSPAGGYAAGITLRWLWGDFKRFLCILRGAPKGYTGDYPSVAQGVKELFGRQPAGTRLETYRAGDPWPAVGEWVGGTEELLAGLRQHRMKRSAGQRRTGHLSVNKGMAGDLSVGEKRVMDDHVIIREASAEELLRWDDLVTRFDNCRVVHKLAWMRSLENCVKGRPLYLVYEKSGEIVGCLPGFLVNVGPLRLFGSPLPGWQTLSMGPVFDERRLSTQEMIPALVTFLERRHGVHHIELLTGGLDQQVMESMSFQIKPSPTYRARLYPGDEARTMKALKDSARRNVRRAEKLGLVVKFEDGEEFVDEHYDQLEEVYTRGGNIIPFDKKRALEFFRQMKVGGNLLAISVHLPDGGPCIATGTFTVEGKELLLWMWAHRTEHRWYRPTELMTWTVMRKAMEAGCDTLDFMGRGDFKAKFGAELDVNKYRWVRSRYKWLYRVRVAAEKSYRWQQSLRGRIVREGLAGLRTGSAKPVSRQSP
ncbi:MAG: GNAT family N-acetyltransferase [Pyrinomonadaceae bacterium]